MLKLLILLFAIILIVRTIGKFVFRLLGGQQQQPPPRQSTQQRRKGEINIDYMPDQQEKKRKSRSKDGDYIDYEEVK